MSLPDIDTAYFQEFLTRLLNTPSPTGYTEEAIAYVESEAQKFSGVRTRRTRKGALLITLDGEREDAPRALTAHVDTLGAMVKEIKSSGRLRLTKLGGYPWNFVEGEGCAVRTEQGALIRGTILFHRASVHVYGQQVDGKREDDSMEVRLDAPTRSQDDTRRLGIQPGDFVFIDPRVEWNNGFVRSRHLDDKACVAVLISALKSLHDAGQKPRQTTYLLISNYEEVGHGAAAGIPSDVVELLAVDMAAVGDGQNSDEHHATLCVKDSGGPYHHGFSQRLRRLAEQEGIDARVDIYPFYGSDGEAFWRAGGDLAVALIGPGVDASHNYERTHTDALVDTARWVLAYLLND